MTMKSTIQQRYKAIPKRKLWVALYGLSFWHMYGWPLYFCALSLLMMWVPLNMGVINFAVLVAMGAIHYLIPLNTLTRLSIKTIRFRRSLYV